MKKLKKNNFFSLKAWSEKIVRVPDKIIYFFRLLHIKDTTPLDTPPDKVYVNVPDSSYYNQMQR